MKSNKTRRSETLPANQSASLNISQSLFYVSFLKFSNIFLLNCLTMLDTCWQLLHTSLHSLSTFFNFMMRDDRKHNPLAAASHSPHADLPLLSALFQIQSDRLVIHSRVIVQLFVSLNSKSLAFCFLPLQGLGLFTVLSLKPWEFLLFLPEKKICIWKFAPVTVLTSLHRMFGKQRNALPFD